MRFQMIPFALSQGQIAPVSTRTPQGNHLTQRAGGDIKYGLTSSMTLDMTVNPDFGQVEADEAVLNLSTFESFFPEKRPFFLEGSQIFDTPLSLFYSRRIGRSPRGSYDLRGGTLLERPSATDIIGAAKLTGRTQSGATMGAISACTANECATVADSTGARHQDMIEPRAVYHVFRLKQDILENSYIGLIVTNTAQNGQNPATTGGVDWRMSFGNNLYEMSGQAAWTRSGQDTRQTGMGTQFRLSKRGGEHIGGSLRYEGFSPGFNPNDLGFLGRANIHRFRGDIEFRGNYPWRFTRRRELGLGTSGSWNFRGVKLGQNFNVEGYIQFLNWWQTFGGYSHSFPVLDDRETRGNGLTRIPGSHDFWWGVETDFRKSVSATLFINAGTLRDGTYQSFDLFSRIRIMNNIELRLGPEYSRTRKVSRWVANLDDPGGSGVQIPVFGELDTDRFSFVSRANMTFTKTLSLQLYNQLFFAVGRYKRFKELTSPDTFGPLTPLITFDNPDFNSRSMNMNAVLRWEYRPGSALFLVWTQARSGSGVPGDASFGRNLGGIFDAPAENVLLMKISYWWNV